MVKKTGSSCLELVMSYRHCKPGVCRNFIWSMTSWKRGHTCQQHSTTTQPSRPSKARPVQGLQLFLRVNTVIQEGRCGSHTLVFIPQGFGSLTAGVVATINTAPPFQKVTCCPKTPTLLLLFSTFLLFFLFFSFLFVFFCAGSVLCLRLLNPKPFYLHMGGWRLVKGYTSYLLVLIRGKKPDKVNILRCKWKGERNAMFIVALYLVIKEHKICLRLFLSEHSLMMFFPSFFTLSWVGGVMQPSHMHPLFFSFGPTPSSSSFLHVHWYLSVFAPPAYFCPVLTPHLSLWVLCQLNVNTSERLCWPSQTWTNSRRG